MSSLVVLYVGEVQGRAPCVLCWYQRAFMFPLVLVLGAGLWWEDKLAGRYGILLAAIGGGIAAYHLGLYIGYLPQQIQPCTATGPSCTDSNQLLLGVPIPLLSLLAFSVIAVLSAMSLKGRSS